MINKNCLIQLIITFLFCFSVVKAESPKTLEELEAAILQAMVDEDAPAVGIALVNKNGPYWIAGLGKADIEKDVDANENTMFRIGSTSKMFVSLAILKFRQF